MRIAFFSATLLASGLAFAAVPIDGWYGSAFGGYSYVPDNISRTHLRTFFTHASYQNGFNAGGRFGFQSNPMRYEGEFTYIGADTKSFRAFRIRHYHTDGQLNSAFGMANVYYDFPEMVPCISPYLGIGIGYGWVQSKFTGRSTLFPNYSHRFEGSGSTFAYQGTAGLTFNYTESWAFNLAYRYVGTTRVRALGKVFQADLGSIGVVYRFNEYNYK